MIALCNPCARAQLHQQKRARKLCSATLNRTRVEVRHRLTHLHRDYQELIAKSFQ